MFNFLALKTMFRTSYKTRKKFSKSGRKVQKKTNRLNDEKPLKSSWKLEKKTKRFIYA